MEIISKYETDLTLILEKENNLEYIGEIDSNGKLKGEGIIRNSNINVKGNFIDGCQRIEKCEINIKDGIRYEGDIEHGLFSGKSCKLNLPCENKYEGDMKYGVPNGSGKFIYKDSSYYMGNWDNGFKEGVGMFIDHNENYLGSWKLGEKHGKGISVICNINFSVSYENGVEMSRVTKKEYEIESKFKELKREMIKKNENIANLQIKLMLKEGYLESLEKFTIDDFCQLNMKIGQMKDKVDNYKKKINDIENIVNCKICYTNISNILLKPCNHLVLCNECNENAIQSTNNRCPLCKVECESTEKIFW